MRIKKVEELSLKEFQPFGFYANHINPKTEKIGKPPVEFFRDMVQLNLGSASVASFSTCRVEKREFVVDVSEYHSSAGEGLLPLDNDIIIHVGPGTPLGSSIPLEKIRILRYLKAPWLFLGQVFGIMPHSPLMINPRISLLFYPRGPMPTTVMSPGLMMKTESRLKYRLLFVAASITFSLCCIITLKLTVI